MGATPSHSKLLTQAARVHLRPLGCVQKGRSRTWLDDRSWFVTVVEFQPSGWSKGAHLNVGAHFLWSWSGHLSFDLGYRIEDFVRYVSDAQFAPQADRLASRAAAAVLSLRAELRTPSAVAGLIHPRSGVTSWEEFHQAVSQGLGDQVSAAQGMFRRMAQPFAGDPAWLVDLRRRSREFAELVVEPLAFRAEVDRLIATQRAALDLPAVHTILSSQLGAAADDRPQAGDRG